MTVETGTALAKFFELLRRNLLFKKKKKKTNAEFKIVYVSWTYSLLPFVTLAFHIAA